MQLCTKKLFQLQWWMEKLWLELGLSPLFSSTLQLSLKTILKNQRWLRYKTVKLICKIICRYTQIVQDLTLIKYESEDSKYTIRLNKYTTHMKIAENEIKLSPSWNDWLYPPNIIRTTLSTVAIIEHSHCRSILI